MSETNTATEDAIPYLVFVLLSRRPLLEGDLCSEDYPLGYYATIWLERGLYMTIISAPLTIKRDDLTLYFARFGVFAYKQVASSSVNPFGLEVPRA